MRVLLLLCIFFALGMTTEETQWKPLEAWGMTYWPWEPARESPLYYHDNGCFHGSDWQRFGPRCFLYVPSGMAWIDAEKHCWRYNANLASLHDQAEYDFIQQTVMAPSRCGNVRIGGYAVRINDWLWSDGSEFWDFGFLDRSRWRRCLTVNCNGMRGWYCEDRRPVICATAVDGQF